MTENESTERKQVFVGNIRKCPNCGAQITTDTAKCPSCGFVIEKEKVSSAMDEFAKKFVELQTDAEKREFVESYPIPNNKEDMRGFLNYAANQRDKDYPTHANKVFWTDAWNNKCRLIVNQAIDVFGTDSEFMQYLRAYKAEVEKSSRENKKLKSRLRFAKIAKISAVAVVVLAIAGIIGGNFYMKQKKRAELIAGCIVPKENVSLGQFTRKDDDGKQDIEILSDAVIKTTNISQRNETSNRADHKDWCLDTTVTFDILSKEDVFDSSFKKAKKLYPEYYAKLEELDLINGKVTFQSPVEYIECAYQSSSVAMHSFDNIVDASRTLYNIKKDKRRTLEIRLTAIAGSQKECENLAIELHKSGKFEFKTNGFMDTMHTKEFEKDIMSRGAKK